jgi:cell division protein FtsZ
LVNITANDEVGLSEFTEVGNIIEEYASEDATVVIGCAIDPSVGEEMRVTVVATGLEGKGGMAQMQSAVGSSLTSSATTSASISQPAAPVAKPVESKAEIASPVNTAVPQAEPVRTSSAESVSQKVDSKTGDSGSVQTTEDKLSYLDIPAFLRRQAD